MTQRGFTNLGSAKEGLWMTLVISAVAVFAGTCGVVKAAGPNTDLELSHQTIEENGVRVNFDVIHTERPQAQSRPFQEADPVLIRFAIVDTTSNTPVRGVFPAAWLDLRRNDE